MNYSFQLNDKQFIFTRWITIQVHTWLFQINIHQTIQLWEGMLCTQRSTHTLFTPWFVLRKERNKTLWEQYKPKKTPLNFEFPLVFIVSPQCTIPRFPSRSSPTPKNLHECIKYILYFIVVDFATWLYCNYHHNNYSTTLTTLSFCFLGFWSFGGLVTCRCPFGW